MSQHCSGGHELVPSALTQGEPSNDYVKGKQQESLCRVQQQEFLWAQNALAFGMRWPACLVGGGGLSVVTSAMIPKIRPSFV